MKNIHIFLLYIIIKNIICNYYCDWSLIVDNEPSVEVCNNARIEPGYCCYYEAPKYDEKRCEDFSQYQYDHIDAIVKYRKAFGKYDDEEVEDKNLKIDCKSFYLEISSLIILLLFL